MSRLIPDRYFREDLREEETRYFITASAFTALFLKRYNRRFIGSVVGVIKDPRMCNVVPI